MQKASADPNINFTLHTIELYDGPIVGQEAGSATRPGLIAGEIGFSIGRVYTSMSGFYDVPNSGTVQLACLGKWLERAGYAFWSLGHCYSPQMDYKRQLGHRIWPRDDFLRKLREHRGPFRLKEGPASELFRHLPDRQACDLKDVLSR